jgi:hypothetical protein
MGGGPVAVFLPLMLCPIMPVPREKRLNDGRNVFVL